MSAHVLDRLSAYLDGELSPPDRALVAEHLAGCEECSRRLQALGVVDAAARELPAEPPAGYFSAFPSRVRRRLEGDTRARSWRAPAWTWVAAAAALLAVVVPLTLMRLPGGSPQEEKAPAPGFAATQPVAPPEAPVAASPARLGPPPAELQARMAKPETRAEASADMAGAAGGRPAPAEALASGGPGAAAPGVLPPPSAPSPLADSREPEAKAAFATPAPRPSPEKDEAKPSAGGDVTARETGTASLERARPPAGEERGARVQGQPEAPAPEGALKRAAPRATVEADRLYRTLLFRSAQTLGEARELREAWRSFSQLHPEGAPADEARVRVVETGARAYRLGSDPEDLARLRDDARAYLDRKDAVQAARVRAVLEALGLQP
jgi:hypothetical protein